MASVKKDTIFGVKWSILEKIAVRGIEFFLGLLLARLLSPSDYGTIGMISIFLAISNTFIDSGFNKALIQKQDRTDLDCSTVFYFNLCVSCFCYLILFFLAPYIAVFFHTPILKAILRVEAVNLIFNALCAVQYSKLTIAIDFKGLAKRGIYSSILSGCTGVILAYLGFGVWALVFQNLFATLFNAVFIWVYSKWRPLWAFSWDSFRALFSFGSYLLLSGLLHTVVSKMSSVIIGRHFTSKDLGEYERGVSIAEFPCSIMNDALGKVTFPILSKLQDDDDRLISVYRKYICMASMCIFFGCCLLAALAKPLILFLLTDKWENAVIYLQIFSFSAMFDHISRINLNLLQVKGRTDYFFKLEIIKKSISLGILFCAIPFGVIGICFSRVIYAQIATFINTYYTGKLFNLGYFEQFKDFGGFLVFSILSCLPAYLLTLLEMNHFLTLLIGGSISLALYLLILRKNPYKIELLGMIKEVSPIKFGK